MKRNIKQQKTVKSKVQKKLIPSAKGTEIEDVNQLLKMQVDAEEDDFGQTDDEGEPLSDSDEENMTQGSQSEIQFNIRPGRKTPEIPVRVTQEVENWQNSVPSTSGGAAQASPQMSAREKIKEIDQEMMGKIRDLHQYMLDQGLSESSNLMEECFDDEGRPRGSR